MLRRRTMFGAIVPALVLVLSGCRPGNADEGIQMQSIAFTRAVYGFRSDREPFAGKKPEDIASQLTAWGCNAVFLGNESVEVIRALHRQGIRCYREIGLFQGCQYWEKRPETRPIQADGTPLEKDEWYCGLCPNVDWFRREKLEEIQKVVSTTEIDGIWLDFIRYPVHWEVQQPRLPQTCFCPGCLQKFAADSNVRLPTGESVRVISKYILDNHAEAWYRWRAGRIKSYVQDVATIAKGEKPEILVGLFSVPWFRGERDDAIWKVVGQDFPTLAAHVDVFSPMVYHRMVGQPPSWISSCVKHLRAQTGKPVWPIIQGCSIPSQLSKDEFLQAIHMAQLKPSQGVIIFALGHLVKENRLEDLADAWSARPLEVAE